MPAVDFTKNENALTRGSDFFVSTPLRETESTDLKAKTLAMTEFVSSWNPSFSVRRNRPILKPGTSISYEKPGCPGEREGRLPGSRAAPQET